MQKFACVVLCRVLSVALFLSILPANEALAQTGGEGFALEEILVTARKREESLQDAPIAVSAFTARDLEFRQISGTDQLGDITPNITFDSASPSSGSSSAAQIFIRGIGQTDFTPVTDPGVGLYVDGVYMARSVGNVLDFLDVERVEVLRGPQGTLFGRNTIGGAVAIHSKRPSAVPEASIKGQFGNDDMLFFTVAADGPITDNLAGNLAFSYRDRDGYVKRTDGVDLGDDDSRAMRGSLLLDVMENLQAYVTLDYSATRENGAPNVSAGVNHEQNFGVIGNALADSCAALSINESYNGMGPPHVPASPVGGVTGMVPEDGAEGCYTRSSVAGPYTSEGTFPAQSHLDVWGVSGDLNWEVNEWLAVKSITAYREVEMESSRDGDHTPLNIFATVDFYDHEQFSQELQLSGRALDDGLQWLAGFYYFQEDGSNINPVTLPVGAIQSGGLYENDSLAAFFQGVYSATERLDLTFGFRYTEDTKRFTPDQVALGDASQGENSVFQPTWPMFTGMYSGPMGINLAAGDRILLFRESKSGFDDLSLMANIAYHWSYEFMAYFTYSEGFKSGGFDQRYAGRAGRTGADEKPSTFDPETVRSYELGLKSQWLDNSLRLNMAIFHTDYSDLQLIIRETFNPITFNGGKADINGGEVELTWAPTERWFITAAAGYIDAEYKQLSQVVRENNTPILPNYKLVNTPPWSAAIGVAYTLDLGDWATLTPRLDWSYHGEQHNNAVNTEQLFQDDYSLLNASMAVETNDGVWEAILAFRNITDKEYIITGNSAFATAASYAARVYGRPFEWSLSIKCNFF